MMYIIVFLFASMFYIFGVMGFSRTGIPLSSRRNLLGKPAIRVGFCFLFASVMVVLATNLYVIFWLPGDEYKIVLLISGLFLCAGYLGFRVQWREMKQADESWNDLSIRREPCPDCGTPLTRRLTVWGDGFGEEVNITTPYYSGVVYKCRECGKCWIGDRKHIRRIAQEEALGLYFKEKIEVLGHSVREK